VYCPRNATRSGHIERVSEKRSWNSRKLDDTIQRLHNQHDEDSMSPKRTPRSRRSPRFTDEETSRMKERVRS